ncbi:TetR/AcrR family transcriptional regulator [Leptolyngbya iicbica]|uniref:TetR/AcrR family transcriptional regulator n=2 Tax=Cyanophyceae TaxID=3028117 RepID=A0A4Q7E4N1_9CYAN|nr:TetR/AcrR family transcriptional regulator [Leptolyngbya sp. LK]RZM75012.1 TetR/AcrR family transcriptional regulator [Leptolyngbya sp. LK]
MPKIVDHDRYRRELLAQCLSLFAEQGFGAVTMRQIAGSLGVSTGTLYHYFPNKESIFVQLVEEYCNQDVPKFFAQAPIDATPEEKLRCVMAFFLANYQAFQQQLLIWIDYYQHCQYAGKDSNTVLQQFWQQTQQQLGAYLQWPPEQVDGLLIYLDGLLLQCLYGRSETDIARQIDAFCQLYRSR